MNRLVLRVIRAGLRRVAVLSLVLVGSSAFQASADVAQWTSIGPSFIDDKALGTTGVLFSIALDPTDSQTIYVGSHHTQGVWKTTDGGASWVPITDSLQSLAIAALTVDPSAHSRVYVALPELGVFRSENGGADWQQLPGSPSNLTDCCDTLAVNPTNSDILYLTAVDGIHRSTDRGATWQLINSMGQATALIIHPNNANVLYAGIVGQGVFYTADGGDNWTQSNLPTGAPGIRNVRLALSTGVQGLFPETLYTMVLTNSDRRILRSLDGGANFDLRSTDTKYRDTIGVDPLISPLLYANYDVGGSNTLIFSNDSGATFLGQPWDVGTIGPHVDHHQFVTPATGVIYTACDGGLFLSTDYGAHWSFLGHGLANVEFYDIADAATAPNRVIGGTQDNGTLVYDGSSTVWREFQGGDGATVAIDPTNANIVYTMNQYAPSMARVNLANNTRECIACGLVCTDASRCQNLHFQVHPAMADTLLASSEFSLWRAVNPHCSVCPDGGLGSPIAWSAILTPSSGRILRSTVDPTVDLYYAGSSDGRIYAGPGGANWQTVFVHPLGYAVTDIEVDLDDPATVYASFSGTGEGRVYRLRRSSATPASMDAFDITQAAFGLPQELVVKTVAVDRGAPLTVYAGLTCGAQRTLCQGIYQARSIDQGATWQWSPYNDGFPRADVVDLEVHPSSFVMRAGTYGRGAYEVMTSKSCQSDADCDDGDKCNGIETCRPEGVCRAAENQVPTAAICTHLITAECENRGATVSLDGSCSSDPEGCNVSYQWTSPTCSFDDPTQSGPRTHCPLGGNDVALTVKDAVGAASKPDAARVNVVDTTPSVVSCSVATPMLNYTSHSLVNVGLKASAVDKCEGVQPVTVNVFSDEDDQETTTDGVFSPDAKDFAVGTLRLRAEQKKGSDGRVYLIVTSATDSSGNRGINCCTVTVPSASLPAQLAQKVVHNQAEAARTFCLANHGTPPAGYFVIGDGPLVGPKQ